MAVSFSCFVGRIDRSDEVNKVGECANEISTDPAIWYHGGAIGQARYYSRFIAMSIKARMLGTPLTVYEKIF